jgi:peptidoglycan/xylan/chitin deacetylase (PgdA/CDA1 family)
MADDALFLTFDDGPEPEVTIAILDLLAGYDIKATFFVLGEKARWHAQLIHRIFTAGHTLGNHSFNHPRMLGKPFLFLRQQVEATNDILADITGQKPLLFRPPYGYFGPGLLNILKKTGQKMVLWSLSTRDYRSGRTAKQIASCLLQKSRAGKIILCHDSLTNGANTITALREALPELVNRGFTFSPLAGEDR